MKDQSLSIRNANLIANVPIASNKMFLLNFQNDVVKCLKSCVKYSS